MNLDKKREISLQRNKLLTYLKLYKNLESSSSIENMQTKIADKYYRYTMGIIEAITRA